MSHLHYLSVRNICQQKRDLTQHVLHQDFSNADLARDDARAWHNRRICHGELQSVMEFTTQALRTVV